MRATRAYITSFGTTGLLIASALLTLSVMSAFVAFNGFPGEDVQAPIQSLLVQQRQTPVPVPAKPVRAGTLAAARHPGAAASSHRRAAAQRAKRPTASTDPVMQRTTPNASQPAQSPAPSTGSGGGGTTSVGQTTPLTSTGSPSTDPSTVIPQLPSATLPSLTPPPTPPPPDSSLPIDTSGVTGLLGGS